MASGKYFVIQSKLNDLVLDVKGGSCAANTPVITYGHHGGDNQLWYLDYLTGTIRNKKSDLCLDFKNNRAIINYVSPGDRNQQFELMGDHICNRANHNKVIDIIASNLNSSADVCLYNNNGGNNQRWTFKHVPARYFFMISKKSNKVLDIRGANPSPGTDVITWSKKEPQEANQLWYENRHGVLASKLNDLVLDGDRGHIVMAAFDPDVQRQWWLMDGDKVVNRFNTDQVLDVESASTADGAKIIPFKFHGSDNQRWTFQYV